MGFRHPLTDLVDQGARDAAAAAQAAADQASAAAGAAQATADRKVTTYYQPAAPTAGLVVGDLWVDTDDGNQLHRWADGWVKVAPTKLETAGDGSRVRVSSTGGVMGGGSVELLPNTTAAPGVLEAGNNTDGALVALSSPPNLNGRRSQLRLSGIDVGDEAAWLETPPGGRFYVNGEPFRAVRAPVIVTDNGPGATFGHPGPHTLHPARTIDPAALFGKGFGALLILHAQVIADSTGAWQLELRSPALSSTITTYTKVTFGGAQRTAEVTEMVLVPAGQTRSFSTSLGAGTAAITTYADARNNRVRYTVIPVAP